MFFHSLMCSSAFAMSPRPRYACRQRRMNALQARIECEGLFERRYRTRVVASRERGLPEADEHGGRLRGQLARALEERLGLLGLPLIEVAPAQPDQRGHIVRADLEHSTERRHRTGGVALVLVQMRQEIRPPRLLRHQHLRVEVGWLRRRVVLAGMKQHADAAVRPAAFVVGGAGLLDRLEHRLVTLPHLLLHGRIHARQVRQRHVEHRRRRRASAAVTRGIAAGDKQQQHEQSDFGSWALGSWELACFTSRSPAST